MQPFKEYLANWFGTKETEEIRTTENDLNVIWIHGANQTSLSFNFLREHTKFKNEILVNYSSSDKFHYNLDKISEQIQNKGPHFIVGHSMGGLYALHLTQLHRIVGGVSISTPFAGSWTADWAKYIVPSYPLFKDVGRRSIPIKAGMDIKITIPWTQIVTTSGQVPYHGGPNDGVVTIESMKTRNDMKQIELPHTHYETMVSNSVANVIKDCYNETILLHH
tara:strand:+ start:407 stop:1069 length:663 start_codon:yes stop_codon:yes gene_type:complete